ncbi:hypothetical protein KCP74_10305 [Salmonella enterica subsp. enterica]|nr:hypothetical protein KCP74_10305 [Salmonella enterica subsp. enterica]
MYRTGNSLHAAKRFPRRRAGGAASRCRKCLTIKPVTLRPPHVGAISNRPYMPISENPCLGCWRIRITPDQPEIFLIRVRAMRANAATGNLKVFCCRWSYRY